MNYSLLDIYLFGNIDRRLAEWLEEFQDFKDDLPGLCRFSYQQRSCQYLRELQRHIGDDPAELNEVESRRQAFLLTRHYIGRLGSHFKAARILTTAGWKMPRLFENFNILTRPSPKPPSLPPPTDQLTTLEGIIKRMLPAGSEETVRYQEDLAAMDAKFDILKRLHAQFQGKDFMPRVHAELNLLEYFHRKRLPFVDNDRFIACSKPACYCCYHYICHHPGGFVRPSSHGVRYLNWRAPDLVDETDEREKNHRRDILNKVIAQIRLDVFRQIEQRRGPSAWHPDSTTGITYSKKQNTVIGGASDGDLPSDNGDLSDDAKSFSSDASSDDELSLGDDSLSNSDKMSSVLEHTLDKFTNSCE
jgi:OTT_1508-like deaminase